MEQGTFRLIDNVNRTTADELCAALPGGTAFDVAVAYFSSDGYEKILQCVDELLNRDGSVRFVFGIHPSAGAREALQILRAQQARLGGDQVKVRFVRETDQRDFHAKLYITVCGDTAIVVVGSSNLSERGLTSNLEFN